MMTACLLVGLFTMTAWSQQVQVRQPDHFDTSVPLRSMKLQTAPVFSNQPLFMEVPNRTRGDSRAVDGGFSGPDVALQSLAGNAPTALDLSFNGGDSDANASVLGFRVTPPDPHGDVGPNHFVQMVNLVTTIYDNSGNVVMGPFAGNQFWAGFGGLCETTNSGDPIVMYDERADRWVVSQFAINSSTTAPFFQCFAISQTSDPTGAYHRYSYSYTSLNDYPKLGISSDAYLAMYNFFTPPFFFFGGAQIAAYDRDAMLAGTSAAQVIFNLGTTAFGYVPIDVDHFGTDTIDNLFVSTYAPQNQVTIRKIDVDWNNPSGATTSLVSQFAVTSFDADLCTASREACVPQPSPGGSLEALSDRLMTRAQVWDFGTHKSMVFTHTVDAGSGRAGVRWYELRKVGTGSWTLHQSSTYAPADGLHRWVPTIAINGNGDIGLSYMVSSSSVHPEIRYTGQTADQSGTGTMNVTETQIVDGAGSQTGAARAGDYSYTGVDPSDNTSFWATNMYVNEGGSFEWDTRIAKFSLAGGPPPADFITVTAPNGGETWNVNTTQTITWNDNIAGNVKIELFKGGVLNATLAASEPSDGAFSWTIPGTQATGSDYKVRVTSLDNASVTDESDANFTVQAGTNTFVTVTFPNGGESFARGSVVNIAWNDDLTGNVSIRLVRGTSVVRTISSNTASDGAFAWTVPSNQAIASDYKVRITSRDNTAIRDESDAFFSITSAAPSSKGSEVPVTAVLEQNYPNPFNPATTVRYQLGEGGLVRLKVYNLLGQEVASLVNGYREAGTHEVYFDASGMSAGVYLYTLEAGGVVQTQRMTLLK
jgi:hypothetical protein